MMLASIVESSSTKRTVDPHRAQSLGLGQLRRKPGDRARVGEVGLASEGLEYVARLSSGRGDVGAFAGRVLIEHDDVAVARAPLRWSFEFS